MRKQIEEYEAAFLAEGIEPGKAFDLAILQYQKDTIYKKLCLEYMTISEELSSINKLLKAHLTEALMKSQKDHENERTH